MVDLKYGIDHDIIFGGGVQGEMTLVVSGGVVENQFFTAIIDLFKSPAFFEDGDFARIKPGRCFDAHIFIIVRFIERHQRDPPAVFTAVLIELIMVVPVDSLINATADQAGVGRLGPEGAAGGVGPLIRFFIHRPMCKIMSVTVPRHLKFNWVITIGLRDFWGMRKDI